MSIDLVRAIPAPYMMLGVAALVAASMGFGYVKGAQHEALKAAKFEAATEALGKAQTQQSKVINDRNLKLKQESDRAYLKAQNDITALYADYRRVLNRTSSRTVSNLPTSTSHPERICFYRTKFADAMGTLENEISNILEQGDRGISGLNVVKDWAAKQ